MNNPDRRYHEILMELIHLREKDYDGFMNKLYDALSGEFKDMIHDPTPASEKERAIWTMINHFADKEEYEKCAELKKMTEHIKPGTV
jgi:hypothetical protein